MAHARVTCKRCLASLAKRDREFQRKARRGLDSAATRLLRDLDYGDARQWCAVFAVWGDFRDSAARAIAREEGRSVT